MMTRKLSSHTTASASSSSVLLSGLNVFVENVNSRKKYDSFSLPRAPSNLINHQPAVGPSFDSGALSRPDLDAGRPVRLPRPRAALLTAGRLGRSILRFRYDLGKEVFKFPDWFG